MALKARGSGASNTVENIVNIAIGVAQVVATAIAVIMLVVLAIKYISAAPSEKAEIKKGATLYIIGAVLLFGASGVLGIIKNFAKDMTKKNAGGGAGTTTQQGGGAPYKVYSGVGDDGVPFSVWSDGSKTNN